MGGVEFYDKPEHREAIIRGIEQTGFPLENSVVNILKKHKWTVISNRYYLDDIQPAVREIDLVAYRVRSVRDFSVVTTLLISCKKSTSLDWALLSRDIEIGDPNIDWQPVHVWSNCLESKYQLAETPWRSRYLDALDGSAANLLVAVPDAHVFAFQEMACSSGKPQNDKAIFKSVTSLLKALGYELDALPGRIRDRRMYQFNLLSVVDAPALLRLHFDDGDVDVQTRTDDIYLADYIVNRERLTARVHFVQFRDFDEVLDRYDVLNVRNAQFFGKEYDSFYKTVLRESKARDLLMMDWQKQVWWAMRNALPEESRPRFTSEAVSVFFYSGDGHVRIEGGFSEEDVHCLRQHTKLRTRVSKALEDVFHYVGKFEFEQDLIPF